MKKILLSLMIIMALASTSLRAGQTTVMTASDLGITLPVSVTTTNSLTFTVSTANYSRLELYAEIYVSATAATGSLLLSALPCGAGGTPIFNSAVNLSTCAASAGLALSPTNVGHGYNMAALELITSPISTTKILGYMFNGSNVAATAVAGITSPIDFASPQTRFYIINKDGGNAATFSFIVTNLLLYLRTN